MKAIMPKPNAKSTLSILMRCLMHSASTPASVAMVVAMRIGTNTSVGFAAPHCARYIITPIGIRHNPEELRIRNMSIASVAVSFSVLIDCNSCIAFKPSGVAALSSPSMLADTFMNIAPRAGWFFGTDGNRRVNSGPMSLPKNAMIPPRSPIFIKPIHSERMPVSPIEISNACADELNAAFIMSLHIDRFPLIAVSTNATTNVMRKKATQM